MCFIEHGLQGFIFFMCFIEHGLCFCICFIEHGFSCAITGELITPVMNANATMAPKIFFMETPPRYILSF